MTKRKWYLTGWGIVAIICFWPFIIAYYVIKYFYKRNAKPSLTAQATNLNSPSPARNELNSAEGLKSHISWIVNFYKEYGAKYTDAKDPKADIVRTVHSGASEHMCPHCGVIHDFTASRARKCPDCGKQMIVRQGFFLTEDQAGKVDALIEEYYDKSYHAGNLRNAIERIQGYAMNGDYLRAFITVAEAYQQCAIIHLKSDDKGFTAWDYSWGVLNKEAFLLSTKSGTNAHDIIANGYADVIFARSQQCMRQMKYAKTDASRNRHARLAIGNYYSYLAELAAVEYADWRREDAVKYIPLAKAFGSVTSEQMRELQSHIIEHSSAKPSQQAVDALIREVDEYVFLETDPNRMREMIY